MTTAAAPAPASTGEALAMLQTAMTYLAAADATAMPAETQARCLRSLEQLRAIQTAAHAWILGAFAAGKNYTGDAAYSPKAWLIHRTRITKGAAMIHTAWARRAIAHPEVMIALAQGYLVSESYARLICEWTDKLPVGCRPDADDILLAAARAGTDQRDLNALAAEIYVRSLPGGQEDPEPKFEDRSVKLETTFQGAGVLTADLTPECAAVVTTVLDALSAPRGAEDDRSHDQRYHDALHDAMQRLIAGGLLPERAGRSARVWAHISLKDLLDLDAGSALLTEWTAQVQAQWAAARAAASAGGSDGAAWLEGRDAEGFACDASLTPVVTGHVDPAVLDDLVRLCTDLAGHGPQDPADSGPSTPAPGSGSQTGRGRRALEQAIIGKAVALVSGPGGLAGFLRRGLLSPRLAGPSLPLDIGVSRDIPAAIRKAVVLRDGHCRFPGGCDQPAAACEVHHLTHKANGGKTSVQDCALFCFYHHHVVIHQWGWTVVLNPDGTTTAWNPERTKVLHSHGPPAPPG
jgi:Domain of unknown function (DUF222)